MADRNPPTTTDTHSDNTAQQEAVFLQHNVTIESNVLGIKQTFYLVTAEQIDVYAEMGLLAELCLVLFGAAIGAAVSFWITLKQGGLSPTANATLNTAMWASVVIAVITGLFAGLFYWRQRKHKRGLFVNTLS